MASPEFKQEVIDFLREEITEDRTDELIDYLFDLAGPKIPFYLKPFVGIAKGFVDRMLPEQLIDAIAKLLKVEA